MYVAGVRSHESDACDSTIARSGEVGDHASQPPHGGDDRNGRRGLWRGSAVAWARRVRRESRGQLGKRRRFFRLPRLERVDRDARRPQSHPILADPRSPQGPPNRSVKPFDENTFPALKGGSWLGRYAILTLGNGRCRGVLSSRVRQISRNGKFESRTGSTVLTWCWEGTEGADPPTPSAASESLSRFYPMGEPTE